MVNEMEDLIAAKKPAAANPPQAVATHPYFKRIWKILGASSISPTRRLTAQDAIAEADRTLTQIDAQGIDPALSRLQVLAVETTLVKQLTAILEEDIEASRETAENDPEEAKRILGRQDAIAALKTVADTLFAELSADKTPKPKNPHAPPTFQENKETEKKKQDLPKP